MFGAGTPAPKPRERATLRQLNVRYCHAYAEGRTCRAGERCQFPHITTEEVERRAAASVGAAASAQGARPAGAYLSQLQEYMTTAAARGMTSEGKKRCRERR
jgi:hypothetical protein